MLRWFESRIDPFAQRQAEQPPDSLLRFYWHHVAPVWPAFAALVVIDFLAALSEVALLAFLGKLVDMMKLADTPATFMADNWSALLMMAFVALAVRPFLFTAFDIAKNQVIAAPFQTRVRWNSHAYVLRQSLGYFQNDFAGRIANKVMQTASAMRDSIVQLSDAAVYVSVQWLAALGLFLAIDVWLVTPLLVWLACYASVLVYFVPRIRKRSMAASEARSMLLGRIVDSYTNILTVKLFAHAEREDAYAQKALAEQTEKQQASLRLTTAMTAVLFTLNGLLITGATALALTLWSAGSVSLGGVALVTTLVIRISQMSGWVLFLVAGLFENIGVVEEGMEMISRPHQIVDAPDARTLEVPRGEIRFEGIGFNYGSIKGLPGADPKRIIEGLSLTIRPGEKVGLVGRSGAGKSTLVNLLLRFYDLERGRILIDGQDIAKVTQESLRAKIGMVTQDTSLLHRSVLDNILYGRPEAGLDGAIEAARRAHAHEFILGLEDKDGRTGYEARVGERGVKLSGGQRQRIAIARVLLKDAPILIMDEATSALDSEAEGAIQEQLFNLMADKTVIAIAHRLSTIAAMDRLIVLDAGHIVEEGTHDELLRKGGHYASLWARQSGGFRAHEAATI
ncbi:MAG: ABC transporter ATP-binding protein [Hyphomicrobiaceae bacterium]|nr:ABC transporter ATP-binding protein [Hyphomicrobiaceae bacterium]